MVGDTSSIFTSMFSLFVEKKDLKKFLDNIKDTRYLNSLKAKVANELKEVEISYNTLLNKQAKLLANQDKLEILKKRPKECKIDDCAFIAEALKYEGLESQITDVKLKIAGMNTRKQKY